MSILDIDNNINDIYKFQTGDIVEQYLKDINGFVNPKIPFMFASELKIINGVKDKLNDDDVLVRDNTWAQHYNMDGYYFCHPTYINLHFPFPKAQVTVIKECVAPGIYKRVTWGWIKKHFNVTI